MPPVRRRTNVPLIHILSREIRLWRVIVLFVSICALLISALWFYGKWNQPRSWQLRSGMTPDEVIAITGPPHTILGDEQNQDWWYRDEERLQLRFFDGRLTSAGKGHPVNYRRR